MIGVLFVAMASSELMDIFDNKIKTVAGHVSSYMPVNVFTTQKQWKLL